MTNLKSKFKATDGLLVVALGASAYASTQPSNLTRANFVKMDQGRVSDVEFNAIKRRCASLGGRQFGSHAAGNMNFTIGNTGPAALSMSIPVTGQMSGSVGPPRAISQGILQRN